MSNGIALIARAPWTPLARQLAGMFGTAALPSRDPACRVAIYAEPWLLDTPLPVLAEAAAVLDLRGVVAANPASGTAAERRWYVAMAGRCRGAALAVVGGAAERGFWSALLAETALGIPLVELPFAPPPIDGARRERVARIAGGSVLAPALRPLFAAVVEWARAEGWEVELAEPRDHRELLAASGVRAAVQGTLPALLIDLREDTPAERLTLPTTIAEALAAGVPVWSAVPAMRAWLGEAGRTVSRGFAPADPLKARAAASALAAERAGTLDGAAVHAALDRAREASAAARAAWSAPRGAVRPLGPGGQLLVLSDEHESVVAARVHLPFAALVERGAIDGYTVIHPRRLAEGGALPEVVDEFHAIWVERSVVPAARVLLGLLGRPFVYEIDDDVLIQASYHRYTLPAAGIAAARAMLAAADTIACSTERLAGLLAEDFDRPLAGRVLVCPNLADAPPLPSPAGAPTAVVWASSDVPALTASLDDFRRALRDFCLAHQLKLVCIGAVATDYFAAVGVEVESAGLLPPAEYRDALARLAPAILACPLEDRADPITQRYVDGKSDIKLIEAAISGLVPVCSRAAAYLDSDLPGSIFAENDYDGWLAGFAAARARCLAGEGIGGWPERRATAAWGLAPWAEALARVRLDRPFSLGELRATLARYDALTWPDLQEADFDESFYLLCNPDIAAAVEAGEMPSGYAHYIANGRAERREARVRTPLGALAGDWWTGLNGAIDRIDAGLAGREERIAELERRLAFRRAISSAGR